MSKLDFREQEQGQGHPLRGQHSNWAGDDGSWDQGKHGRAETMRDGVEGAVKEKGHLRGDSQIWSLNQGE